MFNFLKISLLFLASIHLAPGQLLALENVKRTDCNSLPVRVLSLGSRGKDVKWLQVFLNDTRETALATAKVGSPGFETTLFGAATRNSVRKFQKLNGLSVTGTFSTTDSTFAKQLCQGQRSSNTATTIIQPAQVQAQTTIQTQTQAIPVPQAQTITSPSTPLTLTLTPKSPDANPGYLYLFTLSANKDIQVPDLKSFIVENAKITEVRRLSGNSFLVVAELADNVRKFSIEVEADTIKAVDGGTNERISNTLSATFTKQPINLDKTFDDFAEADTTPVSPSEGGYLARYKVGSNGSVSFVSGNDQTAYRNLLNKILEVVPANIVSQYIEYFEITNDTSNNNAKTVASVSSVLGSDKFSYEIYYDNFQGDEYSHRAMVVIHELAHALSLHSKNLVSSQGCSTFFYQGYCYSSQSVINQFNQKFWSGGALPYTESRYVSDYAASSVPEDFAESFAYYVFTSMYEVPWLSPLPEDSLAKQRMKFFDSQTEYVNLKNEIVALFNKSQYKQGIDYQYGL